MSNNLSGTKENLKFSVIGLNHSHIYGMVELLRKTGKAELNLVYSDRSELLKPFLERFPEARAAISEEQVLEDDETRLVLSAAINDERGPLAAKVLERGKSFFVDKPPVTEPEHVESIRKAAKSGKGLFYVYWGERLKSKSLIKMKQMIEDGAIGLPVYFMGLGPHKLNKQKRPDWMFSRKRYGGILMDIASHQFELFNHLTGEDVIVQNSRVANYHNLDTPEFEDFGDAMFIGSRGTSGYVRVDWFTPGGLPVFGDVRQIVVGTQGYLENRGNIDIGCNMRGNHLFYVGQDKAPEKVDVSEVDAAKFADSLIDEIRQGVNESQPHENTFKVLEAIVKIQKNALRLDENTKKKS